VMLKQCLAKLKDRHGEIISEIRGEGLMQGIVSRVPVNDFAAAARAAGILVVPAAENVARLLPPKAALRATRARAERFLARKAPGGAPRENPQPFALPSPRPAAQLSRMPSSVALSLPIPNWKISYCCAPTAFPHIT